jgi:hypothetical protein
LTVKEAALELAKAVPAELLPEIETLYAAGADTLTEPGIVNVTRRVVPVTVARAVACVLTPVPPLLGVSVTVTLAGRIVPTGKFEPVTLMLVTPGSPTLGEALGKSVIAIGF